LLGGISEKIVQPANLLPCLDSVVFSYVVKCRKSVGIISPFFYCLTRMRRHAAVCGTTFSLELVAVQSLSPRVTSFPLVCLHLAELFVHAQPVNVQISGCHCINYWWCVSISKAQSSFYCMALRHVNQNRQMKKAQRWNDKMRFLAYCLL
jgi:hypothetical protein